MRQQRRVFLTVFSEQADLAAFATALERRRTDYQTLLRGLTFPRPADDSVMPAYEEFLPEVRDRLLGIEDSHVLVRSPLLFPRVLPP